jgi:hypothetical protein
VRRSSLAGLVVEESKAADLLVGVVQQLVKRLGDRFAADAGKLLDYRG